MIREVPRRLLFLLIVLAALLEGGCNTPRSLTNEKPLLKSGDAYCGVGTLTLALEPDWSCFQAMEEGTKRGLGLYLGDSLIIFDRPDELNIEKGMMPLYVERMRQELSSRIDLKGDTKELTIGEVNLAFLEGGSKKDKKRSRREGVWQIAGKGSRFVQVYLTSDGDNGMGELRAASSAIRLSASHGTPD
jgi:hypothetical protein